MDLYALMYVYETNAFYKKSPSATPCCCLNSFGLVFAYGHCCGQSPYERQGPHDQRDTQNLGQYTNTSNISDNPEVAEPADTLQTAESFAESFAEPFSETLYWNYDVQTEDIVAIYKVHNDEMFCSVSPFYKDILSRRKHNY